MNRVAIAVQLKGPGRLATLQGTEFRVVPAVLVKSQVLLNNLGRTFLPPEDITPAWAETANGAFVVVDHPTSRGTPISAKSPSVLNTSGVGFLFDVRAESGTLKGDVWLDPSRADAVEGLGAVLEALDAGTPVEVSTGFPVEMETSAGVHNGAEYDVILHPRGFDHLAVFADKTGACSVKDGCGLGVNHAGPCEGGAPAELPVVDLPPVPEAVTPEAAANDSAWSRLIGAAARLLGFSRPARNESDEDRYRLLSAAVRVKYGGDDRYVYMDSVFSDEGMVVFQVETQDGAEGAGLFRAAYEIGEDGAVTLGEPERVRRVTTFEPAANAGDHTTEETMNREQMIAQLAAAGTDKEALNKLSDCQLKALCAATPGTGTEGAQNQQGDGWEVAHRYRRQLEELQQQTANAVAAENTERVRLLDAVLYSQNCPWSPEEVRGMDIVQLRKVHAAVCPPKASYAGRGGPRAGNASGGDFSFVRPILDGHRGESVLDRQESN